MKRTTIVRAAWVLAIVPWICAIVVTMLPNNLFTGTARRPLVLVGGQTEQLPTVDYLSSVGGGSVNGTPPIGAGDLVADTFNGLRLTGAGGTGGVSVAQATTAGRHGYENGQRVAVLDYLGDEIGTGRVRSGDNYPESNEYVTWVTMTRDGETVTEAHPTRRVIYRK